MYFISTLVALPILALFYLLYADMKRTSSTGLAAAFSHLGAIEPTNRSNRQASSRRVRWITLNDLDKLIDRSDSVILLDLRTKENANPLALHGSHVLPTSPEHLMELLPWLPPETSVILCGSPDVCKALLQRLSLPSGSAAIYVLGTSHAYAHPQLCLLAALLCSAIAASGQSLTNYVPVSEAALGASSSSRLNSGLNLHYRTQGMNQSSTGYGSGGYKQYPKYGEPGFHHLAIEAGAGLDAPVGNTKKAQTLGYNIKIGSGWNFSPRFGVLAEYEFNRTGIPNALLAASQAPQGNVHIWGLSLDPIYYYKKTGIFGGYVTGGGGFYRKLTSFTEPVDEGTVCDYFYGCYEQYGSQVISHFSSNQGGLNIGTGITHNIGSSGAMVYAEVRYLWINSPKASATQLGSGSVDMIPITFGIRF